MPRDTVELEQVETERTAALMKAERACRKLRDHLQAVVAHDRARGLSDRLTLDHLAELVSGELRPLADPAGRIGRMALARTWRRPGMDWQYNGVAPKASPIGEQKDA